MSKSTVFFAVAAALAVMTANVASARGPGGGGPPGLGGGGPPGFAAVGPGFTGGTPPGWSSPTICHH